MNTKLYKRVHTLATEMLKAADEDDSQQFNDFYAELKTLCEDNEASDKNHPVQWETLADFTEDVEAALPIYEKALGYAEAIKARDYKASIHYAVAILYRELGDVESALDRAKQADICAAKTEDQELQREIKGLLKALR